MDTSDILVNWYKIKTMNNMFSLTETKTKIRIIIYKTAIKYKN